MISLNQRPSLFTALCLYLLVLLASAALIIGTQGNIQVTLIRFLAALILAGGGTALAVQVSGKGWRPLYRRGVKVGPALLCLLIGLLAWPPASWLTFTSNYWLTTSVGQIPPPQLLGSGSNNLAVALQLGLIVPFCYGLLFWGLLQGAAERLGPNWAAGLAGLLYGLFGLVINADVGLSAIPAGCLLGLLAAFASRYTESAWGGILVSVGYGLVRPLLENTPLEVQIFTFLGNAEALFEVRWLLVAVLGGFFAFAFLQVIRVLAAPTPEPAAEKVSKKSGKKAKQKPAPAKRGSLLWLAPLLASLCFVALVGYGEYVIRRGNPLPINTPSDATIVPR
jgi:hypothetical protein